MCNRTAEEFKSFRCYFLRQRQILLRASIVCSRTADLPVLFLFKFIHHSRDVNFPDERSAFFNQLMLNSDRENADSQSFAIATSTFSPPI